MQQLPLDLALQAAPTLAGFVRRGNERLLAHLDALRPGEAPTLIWGPAGCGKSHLLHAVADLALQRGEIVMAVAAATPLPWALPPGAHWLLIDDAHALDAAQQHAAFVSFIEAVGQGATVVASSRVPAVDLALRDDLRTRLAWGPSFALQPLDDLALRQLLLEGGQARGLGLPPELLDYLLLRFPRHPGALMGLLQRLDAFALRLKRAPTVPLLRQMLDDESHAV